MIKHTHKGKLMILKMVIENWGHHEGHKYSDFERTQDWPPIHVQTPALKISKISY